MRTRVAACVAAIGLGLTLVGAALPASAAVDKSVSAANIKALTQAIAKGKKLTYQATYVSVSGGQTTTVTIAQAPPKSNFSSGNGTVINDGKNTYICTLSSGKQTCITSSGANPFLNIEDLFSPAIALGALTEAKAGLVARAEGYKVSQSGATFAGQSSTCVTLSVKGNSGKYCVTKQGLIAYSGSSATSYFKLTKFSSKPAASLFALPAGATTVTLPGGISIP